MATITAMLRCVHVPATIAVLVALGALSAHAQGDAAQTPAQAPPPPPPHPHLELGDARGSWNWPLQMHLTEAAEKKLQQINERAYNRYVNQRDRGERMTVLVWTPPEARRIRAMLVIPELAHSMSFGAHRSLREVATRHEMGVIYLRTVTHVDLLPLILDDIAQPTGIAEYRHAPWVIWGMSAAGRVPAIFTWTHPERTVASISWHAEVPPWTADDRYPPEWARPAQTHLHVNVNGQTEWGQTWYRHVRPGLLNYRRHKDWLPHQMVAYGVDHGDHRPPGNKSDEGIERVTRQRAFNYVALFVDKALTLRLPEEDYPTDGPLPLRKVDESSGWLIHPRAIEQLLGEPWRPLQFDQEAGIYRMDPTGRSGSQVERQPLTEPLLRPAADLDAGQRKQWFWVADRELAEAWFDLHAVRGQAFPGKPEAAHTPGE